MYQVIEFEEMPYADIDTYVCVPESWIKWRDESKRKVIVAYPEEEPSCTQKRVEDGEEYSRDWKCFLAIANIATAGYNTAVELIKFMNYVRIRETKDSNKKISCKKRITEDQENKIRKSKEKLNKKPKRRNMEHYTSSEDESSDDTCVSSDSETDDSDITDEKSIIEDQENKIRKSKEKLNKKPKRRNMEHYTSSEDESSEEVEIAVDPTNHKLAKPSERCCGKPKIILPPEYDPGNPRWSLKYPEPNCRGRMDLLELKQGRQRISLYVDRLGYEKCFEISDDDNSLARNLMMEFFTKSALQVCTLRGKVPAGFGNDASEIRPGLYVHAVNALVDIVIRHGFGHGDESSIRRCLSAKLYSLRSKNN